MYLVYFSYYLNLLLKLILISNNHLMDKLKIMNFTSAKQKCQINENILSNRRKINSIN